MISLSILLINSIRLVYFVVLSFLIAYGILIEGRRVIAHLQIPAFAHVFAEEILPCLVVDVGEFDLRLSLIFA